MVLVYGLALVAFGEGFGDPLTPEFALRQAREIANVAIRGPHDDPQFPPLRPGEGRNVLPTEESRWWTTERDDFTVFYRMADSRAFNIYCSRELTSRVWREDRVISQEKVVLALERLLPVCGYRFGVHIEQLKRTTYGASCAFDARFRPTVEDVPFDVGSAARAVLDAETGRIAELPMSPVPRVPSVLVPTATPEAAGVTMVAEAFRLGAGELVTRQAPMLVITHADSKDLPPAHLDYLLTAWELAPRGALMFEGWYADAASKDKLGHYSRQWMFYVDAKTGNLARVEPFQ